jgi:hypothetical protein
MIVKKLLQIITVTKDDLEGVAATVQSTRSLRAFQNVGQIIVDSSNDATKGKVGELISGQNRLEYCWQPPSGISSAFNLGIVKANAEWVWCLNGRDEVHPDLDANLLLQLLSCSRGDAMIFQIEYMNSDKPPRIRPPLPLLWPPMYPNWIPHPGTFIRTSVFERFGTFDPSFKIAMDTDLWMRVFGENIVVDMISIPVVHYDLGGVSATDYVGRDLEVRRIFRKNIRKLAGMWLSRGIHLFNSYRKK